VNCRKPHSRGAGLDHDQASPQASGRLARQSSLWGKGAVSADVGAGGCPLAARAAVPIAAAPPRREPQHITWDVPRLIQEIVERWSNRVPS
jgi:hypothetical protein